MVQQSDSTDSPAERVNEMIQVIDSDEFRDQIKSLPDPRAEHYLLTRCQTNTNVHRTLEEECSRILDYLYFLQSHNETLDTVSRREVTTYFDQRNLFGICAIEADQYRMTLRRLHAHLWRAFDVQSVAPSTFSKANLTAQIESTPYAKVQPIEIRRLARATRSRRDELMILLAHQAALHTCSITALRVSDYNSKYGFLTVEYNNSFRRVPLVQELDERLQEWIATHHPEAPAKEEPLFPSCVGNHFASSARFWSIVKNAAERAEMQIHRRRVNGDTERRFTPKALRISGVDHWRADGVPDTLCHRFTTRQTKTPFDSEPTSQERSTYEEFREIYDL